jgi:alanine racemase
MTMKSSIVFIKRVRKGTGLSYGLTYKTGRDTYIGTVPVGYADGYMRSLSNKTFCVIDGKKYPLVGMICMDQCLVEFAMMSIPGRSINVRRGDVNRRGSGSMVRYHTL